MKLTTFFQLNYCPSLSASPHLSLSFSLFTLWLGATTPAPMPRLQVAGLPSPKIKRQGGLSERGTSRSIMTPATILFESQPLLFDSSQEKQQSQRRGKTQSIQVLNHHMVYDKENNMNERQSQAEVSHKKRILNKSHKK